MSTMNDPAWDEYLSTGEDPTGGQLEEADEEVPYSIKKRNPKGNGPGCFPVLCLLLIVLAAVGINKTESKKKAAENKARQEYMQRQELEHHWEMNHEYEAYKKREAQAKREAFEQFKEEVRQRSEAINEAKRQQSRSLSGSAYECGYRDGYECGHDDGDCNEGYGYSFLDEVSFRRYGEDYRQGFYVGYKAGFNAGREDYEYIEEL